MEPLKRVPNKWVAKLKLFNFFVPARKPNSYIGQKLEYTRDVIAIAFYVLGFRFFRYFIFLFLLPVSVLTPGAVGSHISSIKLFDKVDRYLMHCALKGKKLVIYCTRCDYHDHKKYKYDCDSDFWEVDEIQGEGICMECAGKSQRDIFDRYDQQSNARSD